jgi:hypothetical protein
MQEVSFFQEQSRQLIENIGRLSGSGQNKGDRDSVSGGPRVHVLLRIQIVDWRRITGALWVRQLMGGGRVGSQKYTGPSTAEGKAALFSRNKATDLIGNKGWG